jgi:hypothetical protein
MGFSWQRYQHHGSAYTHQSKGGGAADSGTGQNSSSLGSQQQVRIETGVIAGVAGRADLVDLE